MLIPQATQQNKMDPISSSKYCKGKTSAKLKQNEGPDSLENQKLPANKF